MKELDKPQPETLQLMALLEDTRLLHERVLTAMRLVAAKINTPDLPMQDRVDMGFICREMEEAFDELRKDAAAHKQLCSKSICLIHVERAIANPERATDKCTGTLATGVSDVKQCPNLPAKGSHESDTFLRELYIPDKVIEAGWIKPDWKAVQEGVTELMAQGKRLPPGISHTFPEYVVTYRRRRK